MFCDTGRVLTVRPNPWFAQCDPRLLFFILIFTAQSSPKSRNSSQDETHLRPQQDQIQLDPTQSVSLDPKHSLCSYTRLAILTLHLSYNPHS